MQFATNSLTKVRRARLSGLVARKQLKNALFSSLPATKTHSERMLIPCSPAQVYAVVKDVTQYKEFVPWCTDSRVLDVDGEATSDGETMRAELEVGFGIFKERYVSLVTLDAPRSIIVSSMETSVLDFLETRWHFLPKGADPNQCWVSFQIEFRFKSELHDSVSSMFMHQVVENMGKAFKDRCAQVHGLSTKGSAS
mgnify:CR=1 FL=1|jgi:ribosome-associated toxin RatA of RatAB toxin-antitoxin module